MNSLLAIDLDVDGEVQLKLLDDAKRYSEIHRSQCQLGADRRHMV